MRSQTRLIGIQQFAQSVSTHNSRLASRECAGTLPRCCLIVSTGV